MVMPATLDAMTPDHQVGLRMGPFERSFNFFEESDRDWIMYNPSNAVQQQMIASQYFQSMAFPQQYLHKVKQATDILREAQSGRPTGIAEFKEALDQADFNYIMQDILYRKLLAAWEVPDSPYEKMSLEIKPPTPRRPGKLFTFDGLTKPFGRVNPGEVPELRYPYDSGIAITVAKYMADVEILFETYLEDDLNALSRIPDALNQAIKSTMGRIYTSNYADSTGWRDTAAGDPFFVTNNDKILNPELGSGSAAGIANKLLANSDFGIATNAPFSIPAVDALQTQISLFLSPDGNPTDIETMYLLHGYALKQIIDNSFRATGFVSERAGGLAAGSGDGEGLFRLQMPGGQMAGITPVNDPYLHVVATANGTAEVFRPTVPCGACSPTRAAGAPSSCTPSSPATRSRWSCAGSRSTAASTAATSRARWTGTPPASGSASSPASSGAMPAAVEYRTASKMATDNLSDEQIRRLRLLSADNASMPDPDGGADVPVPWYTDIDLDDFFLMENCDLQQAAALAMESRAAMLQAGMGGFSSQGVTVNAAAMAQGLFVQADRLRQSYRRA